MIAPATEDKSHHPKIIKLPPESTLFGRLLDQVNAHTRHTKATMSITTKILLTLFILYLIIKISKWIKGRRRLVGAIEKLPGPPNIPFSPIINHTLIVIYLDSLKHKLGTFTLAYHVLSNVHRLFPETGICRFWLGWKPVVILYSPENIEAVLSSTNVINKADEYRFFEPWIGEGLVTSKQVKWRFRRKILTPAFHFRILNDFLPIINGEATKLIRKLNKTKYLAKDKIFDITPLITLCTLDTICETAMGVNINCQDDEHSIYVQSLHEVGEMALRRVTRPWLWFDFIFNLTESGKRFTKAKNMMHEFSTKVILERKAAWEKQLSADKGITGKEINENTTSGKGVDRKDNNTGNSMTLDDLRASSFFTTGNKRLAFLDLMLHQHLTEKTMSIEDIREEVDTFMFAGHDTTAMSISWCLYMLGLHEDIQERTRDELDRIIVEDEIQHFDTDSNCGENVLAKQLKITDITSEQLREMKYLDRVIKELLRMWPSIPFVARQMTEDLMVDNKYLIPEGATCMIFTQALHNNPKYYPKPEVFDPDRFLPENSIGRHPFAYIPFSAGPRNCIGQKFAQMEVKVILAKVIRNYYIKTYDHRDKLAIVGELVLRSRNGLNVRVIPRFK